MSVQHFDKASFAAALASGKPVLVDFWATWCMPCKMFAPILEDVAAELGDKAIVGKLDIDEFPSVAQEYRVMSIPTILLFKDGKEAQRMVGLQAKDAVLELFK